jgi:hypothetical protein
MNITAAAIRTYQNHPSVEWAVRMSVRIHHRIFKPELRPCPFATQEAGCSKINLVRANTMGIMALPAIFSAMAVCGSSGDTTRPEMPGGGCLTSKEDSMQWCIGGNGIPRDPDCNMITGGHQHGGCW